MGLGWLDSVGVDGVWWDWGRRLWLRWSWGGTGWGESGVGCVG